MNELLVGLLRGPLRLDNSRQGAWQSFKRPLVTPSLKLFHGPQRTVLDELFLLEYPSLLASIERPFTSLCFVADMHAHLKRDRKMNFFHTQVIICVCRPGRLTNRSPLSNRIGG